MARKVQDRSWLEMHGRTWRVTFAVPRGLHSKLGTRLKRSLGTDCLAVATQRKSRVVDEFRSIVARELEKLRPQSNSTVSQALALREQLNNADDDLAIDVVLREIARVVADIRGAEIRTRHDDESGEPLPVYDAKRDARAEEFLAIVRGSTTPFSVHHETYLAKTHVKARTKGDDIRAIKYLTHWCSRNKIPAAIESITKKIAVRFMDDLDELTGHLEPATQNKYLNRLSRFWQFMAKREIVAANVWTGLRVEAKPKAYDEEERAFTDTEVRALLMGGAPQKLNDLMMIAALTGARLDAIVDLKVKDVVDGAFTFKPQKRERAARDVPIHKDLEKIVMRRVAGRNPNDDLFPDWPGPKKIGSARERSFKASNAFTEYRRQCGVDERVDGRRRSLVNFHSFRRWFITKAERAGYSGDLIAAIVGHKRRGMTLGRYSEWPEMKMARKCVNTVRLPPLDESPIREDRALTPRRRAEQSGMTKGQI